MQNWFDLPLHEAASGLQYRYTCAKGTYRHPRMFLRWHIYFSKLHYFANNLQIYYFTLSNIYQYCKTIFALHGHIWFETASSFSNEVRFSIQIRDLHVPCLYSLFQGLLLDHQPNESEGNWPDGQCGLVPSLAVSNILGCWYSCSTTGCHIQVGLCIAVVYFSFRCLKPRQPNHRCTLGNTWNATAIFTL